MTDEGQPRGALVAALSGLLLVFTAAVVWSVGGTASPGLAVAVGTGHVPEDPGTTNVTAEVSIADWIEPPQLLSGLLKEQLELQHDDGTTRNVRLSHVIRKGQVTVVNVWAVWCPACKHEFPGLRELQSGWGSPVRFVAIEADAQPGIAAELAAVMPTPRIDLKDYVGTSITKPLLVAGLIPKQALPVSLVFDCKQRLRWRAQGEIQDFAALDKVIGHLKTELHGPGCARDESTPRRSDPEDSGEFPTSVDATTGEEILNVSDSDTRTTKGHRKQCPPGFRLQQEGRGGGACVGDDRDGTDEVPSQLNCRPDEKFVAGNCIKDERE